MARLLELSYKSLILRGSQLLWFLAKGYGLRLAHEWLGEHSFVVAVRDGVRPLVEKFLENEFRVQTS